jgi:hypothetical protein
MMVYGFIEGDTLGLVVILDESESIADATAKLQQAADVRVTPGDAPVLVHRGRVLHPTSTVGAAGIEALDRIDVRSGPCRTS